ncbi:DUF7219 family protein [Iningainema tapete]|uniref:Isopropylmalate/homocitrate/citramalate synthases n=1 Tax=Iningainema tapete BLCC-T55 TaxID=2748662 RepID=A0A8J6XPA1_9CYAN|nr:hypothetical protein [Iningainema tapete]MBD2775630.1 hypothetical protein [Iningainema tapete BLCC-T55]
MKNPNQREKDSFLYPRSRYYGQVKPENLVFNANLQEFAQKVGYIANLQTGGKLSAEEAFKQIEVLWKQLEHSKKELKIATDKENVEEHYGGF